MEIKLAKERQAQEVFSILRSCKHSLDKQDIFQWVDSYPTLSIVEHDIRKGYLHCAMTDDRCVGIVSINEEQEPEYATIGWSDQMGKVVVIHRLAVDPEYQGQGIAKMVMDFAEWYSLEKGFSSIRLDAFSGNERVLRFYENRGYQKRGEVFFAGRELPFFCYELILQGQRDKP